jgi:hypothetical protein
VEEGGQADRASICDSMTHRGPTGLPSRRWAQLEALYPRWRASRHPEAASATTAEIAYLEQALTKTFYIDGDRIDFLMQGALEVMDEWVAAADDPAARRRLKKTDFKIR